MFNLYSIIGSISYINSAMVANDSSDSLLWNFLIILLIVVGIIAGALLFSFSRKPDNWRHTPIVDDFYDSGRLNYFANSVKLAPAEHSNYSPLKNHIQMLFFEKIRMNYGLPAEKLVEMKTKDPNRLRSIIKDNEIADWILDVKQKDEKKKFFKADKEEQKQKYLSDLNLILDKMEAWGK